MGVITFDGEQPYDLLEAQTATTEPTIDGVELVLTVFVEGLPTETVPVRIQLQPEVARALASNPHYRERKTRRPEPTGFA